MERVTKALAKARKQRLDLISNTESIHTNSAPGQIAASSNHLNKWFLVLMIINILGLSFLFFHISDLKQNINLQNPPIHNTQEQPASITTGETISEQLTRVVADVGSEAGQPEATGEGELVDIYFEGALIRMQVVGKLSGDDAAYLAALGQLKSASDNRTLERVTLLADAKTIRAKEPATKEQVDHFNRVIVKIIQNDTRMNKLSFAEQIQQVVNSDTATTTDPEGAEQYIQSLDKESVERKNETRIIKVRRGDSLWRIARRAYGSGFMYPKIFTANPHLTNPDLIEVGDFLRVPL